MLYKFFQGRWHYSTDNGLTWRRTRYAVEVAPVPQYRDRNPKIDLFSVTGNYVGSSNWHRTCNDAFAHFATRHPEKRVAHVQRDRR